MLLAFEILILILLVGYCVLMIFYLLGWQKTQVYKPVESLLQTTVSVIVVARNESLQIKSCLQSILDQDYPKHLFEIIVIDDFSEDQTLAQIEKLQAENLKVLELKDYIIGTNQAFKKQGIALGIKHATGDLIITTDADCIVGKKWISTLASYYEAFNPALIAAPVLFQSEDHWLKKWQSLDLIGMMGVTAGAITNRFPNMCNGANLCYEKKAFTEVSGFEGVDELPTGDDIMLMLKINEKYPGRVKFLRSREAVVYTNPVENLKDLFFQRIRWLSKSTSFQDRKITWVLFLAYLFNVFILIGFFVGMLSVKILILTLAVFTIKMIIEWPLVSSSARFFRKQQLLKYYPIAQVMHIFYIVIIGLASKVYPYKWKGRWYKTFKRNSVGNTYRTAG